MQTIVQTIIGIPGKWEDKEEIINAIALQNNDYILVGEIFYNSNTNESYQLEIYDFDENLVESFMYAGKFTDAELNEISEHLQTIYLIGNSGNINSIISINNAVSALLESGGIAVKVESTGIAHSSKKWYKLTNSNDISDLLQAYVTIVEEGNTYYSCGMHNLGYKDVFITKDMDSKECEDLLWTFLTYVLSSNTTLKQNDTFSLSHNSPVYLVEHEECEMFPKDDLFYNPFGYWRLQKK
jgi:hypothetical protein